MSKSVRTPGSARRLSWIAPLTLLPFACGVSDRAPRDGTPVAVGEAGQAGAAGSPTVEEAGQGGTPASMVGAGGAAGYPDDGIAGGAGDDGGESECGTLGHDFWAKLVKSGPNCVWHRPIAEACEPPQVHDPDGAANGVAGAFGGPSALGGPCDSHADCSAIELGYCDFSPIAGKPGVCKQGCVSDADCEANELCSCVGGSSFAGRCMPTSCHSDSECGPNALCTLVQERACPHASSFACQTVRDECETRADCPLYPAGLGPEHMHQMCAFDGDHRACLNEVDPAIPDNCF